MNKALSFLFVIVAMTATTSLIQASSIQQSSDYSNISVYAPADSTPIKNIQPYVLALDDLVNIPWKASRSDHDPFNVNRRWYKSDHYHIASVPQLDGSIHAAQVLDHLSITLRKHQDLIVTIKHASYFRPEADWSVSHYKEAWHGKIIIDSWGTWNNYLRREPLVDADPPDAPRNMQDNPLTFHFKNQHSGTIEVDFSYCLFSEKDIYANGQTIVVTIE